MEASQVVPETTIKKGSKVKKLVLKLIVSGGLIAFILNKIDLAQVSKSIVSMDFRYIPLVVFFIAGNYVVSSIRWKKLLISKGSQVAGLGYLISLYFTGSFFNNFMPTSIGGDVYKIYKLGNKINDKTSAFTATFLERFLGVLSLAIISVFGAFKLYPKETGIVIALGLVGALIGFKLLNFIASKVKIIKQIVDSVYAYRNNKDVLYFAFIYSFVVQIFAILSQYFVFVALGAHIPLVYSFFVLPIITLAGFFIPSLNGIGVQDTLYVSLFTVVGVTTSTAVTASIIYHLFRLIVSLFGGILYALGMDD